MSNLVHNKLSGLTLKNREDPPTFTATPWNQLTIALRYVQPDVPVYVRSLLDGLGIVQDIRTQLGFDNSLADQPSLELRLKSIRGWATSGTDGKNYSTLNMDVYDVVNSNLTDANTRILQSISDVSGKMTTANVGYNYPVTQTNTILNPDFQNVEVAGFDWLGSVLTVYVEILWRFQPPRNSVDFYNDHQVLSRAGPLRPKAVSNLEAVPEEE